jgi:hypothetical protein
MSTEIPALKKRLAQLEEASGTLVANRGAGPQTGSGSNGGDGKATLTVDWLSWTWETFDHGPVFYRNFVIKLYRTGDWETSCNVEDRSEHSDWDVWVDLWVKSGVTGSEVFRIKDQAWFQDLDVGENYNKTASGFSAQIRDYWSDLQSNTFYPMFTAHRVRDN